MKIGDIVRYKSGNDDRLGNVVDVSLMGPRQELTVMVLVEDKVGDVVSFKPSLLINLLYYLKKKLKF